MMAAIKAAEALLSAGFGIGSGQDSESGVDIVLYDKNDRLGRKIYLTGKGRCNITNMRKWDEFAPHIHPNQEFLKFAFRAFSNEDVRIFFDSVGVPTTIEQGQRLFPVSMRAADVAQALERRVNELGIKVIRKPVGSIMNLLDNNIVILATGGKSYPVTGSTGDGYAMAAEAGHTISKTFPSLTALMPAGFDGGLEGMDLKNVALHLYIDRILVQSEEGEMSFTNDGIEGALGYRVSRRAVWAMMNGQKVVLSLDLKPGMTIEKLNNRLSREFSDSSLNAGVLRKLMPEQLIEPFRRSNPDLNMTNLANRLKDWRFRIESWKGYERSVVTAGGVSLKEIVPKTMSSRILGNLFFAGEVMDIDGDTGGYNLQIAFSTGALAGSSAAKLYIKQKNSPDSLI